MPLHTVVAIASHIVSAFRKHLKLTKAKANLKFTYVAETTFFPVLERDTFPYPGPQTLRLFKIRQNIQLTIFQQRKEKTHTRTQPKTSALTLYRLLCILCYKPQNIFSPFNLCSGGRG